MEEAVRRSDIFNDEAGDNGMMEGLLSDCSFVGAYGDAGILSPCSFVLFA